MIGRPHMLNSFLDTLKEVRSLFKLLNLISSGNGTSGSIKAGTELSVLSVESTILVADDLLMHFEVTQGTTVVTERDLLIHKIREILCISNFITFYLIG